MSLRILICVALIVLAGCGEVTPDNTSIESMLTLKPCLKKSEDAPPRVVGGECGSLDVLENPFDATSRKISLNILRWPAISPVPELDPVFVIAGGPGQSSVTIAPLLSSAPVFADLRKKRDIIFVDQRGTGESSPMQCESEEKIEFPFLQSTGNAIRKDIEIMAICAEKYKSQAAYYTTPFAVIDLERIRESLGYVKINLWGASYGTRVILEYISQFPDSLRAVVMDGVAPVQLALPAFVEADAYASLTKISDSCIALPACETTYGNVLEKAKSISMRLEGTPVQLSIKHPLTEAETSILIDEVKFSAMLRFALYDRTLATLLPRLIAASYEGDYQLLSSLIMQYFVDKKPKEIAKGMHVNILCNEDKGYQYSTRKPLFFGLNSKVTMANVCEFWPKAPLPERYYEPISGNVPALLLSGGMDPVTPPHWAEAVIKTLPNALHAVASGAHHGVTMQGCTAKVIVKFIKSATVENLNTSCIDAIQPLTPFMGVKSHDKN